MIVPRSGISCDLRVGVSPYRRAGVSAYRRKGVSACRRKGVKGVRAWFRIFERSDFVRLGAPPVCPLCCLPAFAAFVWIRFFRSRRRQGLRNNFVAAFENLFGAPLRNQKKPFLEAFFFLEPLFQIGISNSSSFFLSSGLAVLRRHAATPPRRYAATPLRRHADTPTRRYADMPIRPHADTPSRRYADTPTHLIERESR